MRKFIFTLEFTKMHVPAWLRGVTEQNELNEKKMGEMGWKRKEVERYFLHCKIMRVACAHPKWAGISRVETCALWNTCCCGNCGIFPCHQVFIAARAKCKVAKRRQTCHLTTGIVAYSSLVNYELQQCALAAFLR